MKNSLNNITESEKNRIRKQHQGLLRSVTDKFNQLLETESGKVSPYITEQEKLQEPIKLRLFPVLQKDSEEGASENVVGDFPEFFIEVDAKPIRLDNDEVYFSYSVRGRSEKHEGYFNPNNSEHFNDGRNILWLNICDLRGVNDADYEFLSVNGKKEGCEERPFELTRKGNKLMHAAFGVGGYAMNGGSDNSNLA